MPVFDSKHDDLGADLEKLNVLHIYKSYFPESRGGVEEAIQQMCLATGALNVGNRVFALAQHPSPSTLVRPEASITRAKSWARIASCDIGALDAFRLFTQQARKADILHVHYPWPFADLLVWYACQQRQPIVVTYHSDIVRQRAMQYVYAPLRNLLLRSASAIVATSPTYAQTSVTLKKYVGKVCSIPLCLAETSSDETTTSFWRARWGADFFLFVGVLRYYKGLEFLLSAASEISLPILIVGDGPEKSHLLQQAQKMRLSNVHFLGALPDRDKLALLSLCRAVVFPSHLRSEAFGMTLLEGARAGKPLISCELGSGTSWVNRHMETGLVVPPANPQSLAAAMKSLQADDTLCRRLGVSAQKRWREYFTPDVVGPSYRQLYDRVSGNTSQSQP